MSDDVEPRVVVEYRLTKKEVAGALRWDLLRRRNLYLIPVSGAVAIAIGIAVIAGGSTGAGAVMVGIGLDLLLLLPYILWKAPSKALRRNERLLERQRMSFSDEGVEAQTDVSEGRSRWAFWKAARETDECYLLQIAGRRAFNIIPKRAFSSPEDEGQFRLLVEVHTESQLRPRRT